MTTTYNVYRRIAPAAQTLRASGLTTPAYIDTGLTNGVEVGYQVSAVNSDLGIGEGAKSAEVLATPTAPAPPSGNSITVSSIPALKAALLDNQWDEIIVEDGTYFPANAQAYGTSSLFIGGSAGTGGNFAARTRPVLVRAETPGGVTFDGGGTVGNYVLWFGTGAHHQTWDGFRVANTKGTVVGFGGFTPTAPPHDITLKNISFASTCRTTVLGTNQHHVIYLANATGRGPYNLLFEDIDVDGTDPLCLWGGFHGYHNDPGSFAPDHVTIRRFTCDGLFRPYVAWYDQGGGPQHHWTMEDSTIQNAREYAVQHQSTGAVTDILFDNVVSTNSGSAGFYSSQGANPPGVTKTGCSFG